MRVSSKLLTCVSAESERAHLISLKKLTPAPPPLKLLLLTPYDDDDDDDDDAIAGMCARKVKVRFRG